MKKCLGYADNKTDEILTGVVTLPHGHVVARCVASRLIRLGVIVAATVLAWMTSTGLASAECIDYGDFLHWVGSVDAPGGCSDIAISGSHAYVAANSDGLQVIDISDPASPQVAGAVDTPGHAKSVAISGFNAFLADGSGGLQVIDISDPMNPHIVGVHSYDPEFQSYLSVAVSGTYAYVGDNYWVNTGFRVINVADPTDPQQVGFVVTNYDVLGTAISGNYAYAATSGAGLLVIDITVPSNPQIVGNIDALIAASDVVILGSYAYVASFSGFQVIDITNPTDPQLVGSADANDVSHVAIIDTYAYVMSADGLQAIDVTNPSSPQIVGNVAGHCSLGIAVSGAFAYTGSLLAIDISNPASPLVIGGVETTDRAFGVTLLGDHAFVADGIAGLQVINVTDPWNPLIAGGVDTPSSGLGAQGLTAAGTHAFIADGAAGLQIIDISDPVDPQIVGSVDLPDYARGVAVQGVLACVTADSSLQVIDITNPEIPQLLGSIGTPGTANDVAVTGIHTYVCENHAGLQVIDISDPTSPQIIGSVDTPGHANDVALSDSHAFIADGSSGLQVIDITNPASPQIVGGLAIPGYARGVGLSGNHAYVASSWAGLQVIDITTPANPEIVGCLNTPSSARGVAITGSNIFIGDDRSGLQILPAQCSVLPPPAPSDLAASSLSVTQVGLSWADNSSFEDGFRIERGGSDAGPFTEVVMVGPNSTGFADNSLLPATTYWYRVYAYTSPAGDSEGYAGPVSVTTIDVPPEMPSDLSATAMSSSRIDLRWADNSSNETGFRIEYSSGGSGGPYSPIDTVAAGQIDYTDIGLSPATTRWYRVFAYNSAGDSEGSAGPVSATTFDVPPEIPTALSTEAMTGRRIDLYWVDNSDKEDGFDIYRRLGDTGDFDSLATVSADVTFFSDDNLNRGTTYYYFVVAYNTGGDSGASNIAHATTDALPYGPFPQPITVASSGPLRIEAVIHDDAGVDSARLFYRFGGDDTFDHTIPMSQPDAVSRPTLWQAAEDIPIDHLTERGLQYYIEAYDQYPDEPGVIPLDSPSESLACVQVEYNNFWAFALPPNTHMMLGVPLAVTPPHPIVVFDELGEYNRRHWRYWTTPYDYDLRQYTEYPDSATAVPVLGQGFWIISRDYSEIYIAGKTNRLDRNHVIPLQRGWNLLANPYAFVFALARMQLSSGATLDLRIYDRTINNYRRVPPEGSLDVGQAAWVDCALPSDSLVFSVIGHQAQKCPARPQQALPDPGSCVFVQARADAYEDPENRFGLRSGATVHQDGCDLHKIPLPPADHISVCFIGEDGSRLMTDYRALESTGETWNLLLTSTLIGTEYCLRFDIESSFPDGWGLWAIDEDRILVVDLRSEPAIRGHISSSRYAKSWQVVAGLDHYFQDIWQTAEDSFQQNVKEFTLGPGYPNPFRSGEKTFLSLEIPRNLPCGINIYDIQGRLIRALHQGELHRGRQYLFWDGRDAHGRQMASGVYFIRLQAPGISQARKVILVK